MESLANRFPRAKTICSQKKISAKRSVRAESGRSHACLASSLMLTIKPTYDAANMRATTQAPSSYEAERVILSVEYSRSDTRMIAKTNVVALTATVASANVTGLTTLGFTPGGGAADGI